ncbi:MAG: hypothetical protein A2119_01580 [Candidatus Colwellbacteria bacterium GWA2_46_10]|uniref:Fibronectin type-III domain-containing protein n=2 Tax=Parcubacteria group TaxID=1794811 RepID=A0A1G1YW74_9BACT|nr:MAG: hypothetical protein UX29_C0001G0057 [Parcubacteria group bacterium GW2011_GWA2_46_10]OGY56574.1 MAG: hypothetical protein A2119_01580 [Candidatus Colwellbacteria bacterium GWA2_46_10]
MNQPSKLTQYLASTLLVGLILPVSLLAQFQSVFAKGKIQSARDNRATAREELDATKDTVKVAKDALAADTDNLALRIALNEAQAAKVAQRLALDQARLKVQQAKLDNGLNKGRITQEEYDGAIADIDTARGALNSVAETLHIGDDGAVGLSTSDPANILTLRAARRASVDAHDTKVRTAVIKTKVISSSAAIRGLVRFAEENGITNQVNTACGGKINTAQNNLASDDVKSGHLSLQEALKCVRGVVHSIDTAVTRPGGGDGGTEAIAPKPTVNISAASASIDSGTATYIAWGSQNTTHCVSSWGLSETVSVSGSVSTGALATSTTYTIKCTGEGGEATDSVTVNVKSLSTPPSETLTCVYLWGSWSTCPPIDGAEQSRTGTISVTQSNGGAYCKHYETETRSCD